MALQVNGEQRLDGRPARRGYQTGGAVLVAVGLFLLAAQALPERQVGMLFLPALGGVFLIAGLVARNVGLLVPGGVLMGIGTGVYLLEGSVLTSFGYYVDGAAEAGVILLSLAAGFVLVSLASTLVTLKVHVWPLFPAAVIGSIGGLLMMGDEGLRVLETVGHYWPLALILAGAVLLLRRNQA